MRNLGNSRFWEGHQQIWKAPSLTTSFWKPMSVPYMFPIAGIFAWLICTLQFSEMSTVSSMINDSGLTRAQSFNGYPLDNSDVFRQLMRRRLRNIKNTNRKEGKHRYGSLVHPRAHGPINGRIQIVSALRIPGGVFWSFGVLVLMFCPASKTKQSWTSQKLHEITDFPLPSWFLRFMSSHQPVTNLVHYAHFIEKLRMEKLRRSPSSWLFQAARCCHKLSQPCFLGESIPNSEFSLPRTQKGIDHNIGI